MTYGLLPHFFSIFLWDRLPGEYGGGAEKFPVPPSSHFNLMLHKTSFLIRIFLFKVFCFSRLCLIVFFSCGLSPLFFLWDFPPAMLAKKGVGLLLLFQYFWSSPDSPTFSFHFILQACYPKNAFERFFCFFLHTPVYRSGFEHCPLTGW